MQSDCSLAHALEQAFIIKSRERAAYSRRVETVYREPVTGDSVRWVGDAVAVRRLLLPYLTATMPDGLEHLLNREYKPIWTRCAGGSAVRAVPGSFYFYTAGPYIYRDGTPEPRRVAAGRRVCAEWGIALPERLADLVRVAS